MHKKSIDKRESNLKIGHDLAKLAEMVRLAAIKCTPYQRSAVCLELSIVKIS